MADGSVMGNAAGEPIADERCRIVSLWNLLPIKTRILAIGARGAVLLGFVNRVFNEVVDDIAVANN